MARIIDVRGVRKQSGWQIPVLAGPVGCLHDNCISEPAFAAAAEYSVAGRSVASSRFSGMMYFRKFGKFSEISADKIESGSLTG